MVNIREISVVELNSYFEMISKIRDGVMMSARMGASNVEDVRFANEKFKLIQDEAMRRLREVECVEISEKELLCEENVKEVME